MKAINVRVLFAYCYTLLFLAKRTCEVTIWRENYEAALQFSDWCNNAVQDCNGHMSTVTTMSSSEAALQSLNVEGGDVKDPQRCSRGQQEAEAPLTGRTGLS